MWSCAACGQRWTIHLRPNWSIQSAAWVMFSKRPEPRSIASQLILLFTLAAALLLACGLGVFYWIVIRHAFAEDNAVLADKVDGLQTSFEQRGGFAAVAAEIDAAGTRQRAPFMVRVLDPAGPIIGQTTRMETLLPANIFPPVASRETAAPTEYRVAGKLFALTTRHALAGGKQFTIQVAQDRSSDEQVERRFGILALLVLSGSILASILIAIPVTRRGLRPLGEMKRSLERIGPTHLNERVASATWPRELQPMAIAFDEMLKRLDDSFTRLSQFSADLAHELRTPIANMLGEAQVALSRDRSSAEYRETIESTIGECERLSGIVDNLLSSRAPMQHASRSSGSGSTRARQWRKLRRFMKRSQKIAMARSIAGAGDKFLPTPPCSSAPWAIWWTTRCVLLLRTVQFKSPLSSTRRISRSQSAIMALE